MSTSPERAWKVHRILGVRLDALRFDAVLDLAEQTIAQRTRLLISVVNAAKIVNMRRDPSLRRAVEGSDLIVADGAAVVWAARLLGGSVPERVTGIDLMTALLRRADKRRYRVYLLGATPAVLERAVASIRRAHPGIDVVGSHHGYYAPEEEAQVATQIDAQRPDMLFVGMSSPRKELFLARFAETMHVPIRLGVGGTFDVLAGEVKRAPAIWQRLGMEWLYRMLQEPRRLGRRYLVTSPLFCWMVLVDWLGRRAGAASRRGPD